MFKRFVSASIGLVMVSGAYAQDVNTKTVREQALTDAAVIAIIIAGSVAAYKAMGRPCACPEDVARDGSRCGGRSAWSRAGGYKPLCRIEDVTLPMIQAYRVSKAIPPLK